jgi:hypothetical protein
MSKKMLRTIKRLAEARRDVVAPAPRHTTLAGRHP